MKKYIIAALLLSSLLLTGCSSGDAETIEETESETTISSETESETQPHPTNEEVIDFQKLYLSADPVYENGLLVLYFTSENVSYTADSKCSIGVIATEEAYSIKSSPDFTAYPDMLVSEGKYKGIALRPSEELESGSFKFSITIDGYIVDSFDMTVQ